MGRRIARAIVAASAAGATVAVLGLTAAGTAGAATRPLQAAHYPHAAVATRSGPTAASTLIAGYGTAVLENWKFRSVATTVPVAPCKIAPSKNPFALAQLVTGTKWAAQIGVFCNGGSGSIAFFDQKTASTSSEGVFKLTPRVGDSLAISISRNVASHVDSFTVTNLRTRRSQTVRVTTSTAVVYHHAFLGSAVVNSNAADLTPLPPTAQVLWTFQSSRVVTYSGIAGSLRGPWATLRIVDRSGAVTFMYPGVLSSGGAKFNAILNHA
jgi:hypothetical protein